MICRIRAEFLEEFDGERYLKGRDDVDCPKCGGYSIADEYKHDLAKWTAEKTARDRLSEEVAKRYRSGSGNQVVEINSAFVDEVLK